MKPTVFIAAGTALLGAVVLHQGGYFSSHVTLPNVAQPAGTQAQQDGHSKPLAVADQSDQPAKADATPVAASLAQSAAPAPSQKVDETALRYFASKGDTKRLNAEIARLKALYPDWTPPDNPLAARKEGDPQLDQMWKLYSDGKLAELRKAIADRQTAQAGWQPPTDLMQRLAVAEAREQLVNASNLKQYDAVIRVGSANPSLLTCGDVDVLWRVAEAFASTKREDRAKDAYLYVLSNCKKPEERYATIQKALPLLSRQNLDLLLATEQKTPDRKGEFAALRGDIARQSLANADADPKLVIPAVDVTTVEALARDGGLTSDDLLLGWYYVRRDNPQAAETWFRKARDKENTAKSSQGLALALINQNRPAEAEDILYQWRSTDDDTRKVYLAAVANLLAVTPPAPLKPEVLQRMVQEVYANKDAASAQQLGWYAESLNQAQTAAQWFKLALDWKPDDEPSAYGLALTRWKIGDKAGVKEIQTAWAGRSERIPTVGQRSIETAALGGRRVRAVAPDEATTDQPVRPPAVAQGQASQGQVESPHVARPSRAQPAPRGCSTTLDPSSLAPDAALSRGWCLMQVNRPVEAAAAFEVALRGSGKTRSDAAYGQSLAYLRAGLTDRAAIAASQAPMGSDRSIEIRTALLETQANTAFDMGRYNEAILALDERSRIAPERTGLMVLRGYAYLELRRFADAEQVFRAAASTGDRAALKGINDVRNARNPSAQ
ncbi:tetratricopeptide repeat protein [Mesorhizobium sp. B2-3-14]|uniref:tetratricopeptide repeat protein n=1 Tax=unclassified Mesorhizobium TaxID=325217 RepID=UPI00112ABAC4|nr:MULTISPECIES: tetratricopeptide repeat protein [unclassified Mesorhizobium]TPK72375.1 tetratricopeptide repeat protein [Mesorhizobium sp. B2-4-18]TPL88136.1 tetratricopeptide repeat protein [Mesorhizobium sp. B2-3-14]